MHLFNLCGFGGNQVNDNNLLNKSGTKEEAKANKRSQTDKELDAPKHQTRKKKKGIKQRKKLNRNSDGGYSFFTHNIKTFVAATESEGFEEIGSHTEPRSLVRFMSVLWLPSTILETHKCPHTQGSTHTLAFVRAQTQSRTQMHKHTHK